VPEAREDRKSRTVEYFGPAVFEHHPENGLTYQVLLRRLGASEVKRNYSVLTP
jgi:hypothetical protein